MALLLSIIKIIKTLPGVSSNSRLIFSLQATEVTPPPVKSLPMTLDAQNPSPLATSTPSPLETDISIPSFASAALPVVTGDSPPPTMHVTAPLPAGLLESSDVMM